MTIPDWTDTSLSLTTGRRYPLLSYRRAAEQLLAPQLYGDVAHLDNLRENPPVPLESGFSYAQAPGGIVSITADVSLEKWYQTAPWLFRAYGLKAMPTLCQAWELLGATRRVIRFELMRPGSFPALPDHAGIYIESIHASPDLSPAIAAQVTDLLEPLGYAIGYAPDEVHSPHIDTWDTYAWIYGLTAANQHSLVFNQA